MKEEKEQTVIDKTYLYLENYREMERYINDAVSEVSQIPDAGRYNISRAGVPTINKGVQGRDRHPV